MKVLIRVWVLAFALLLVAGSAFADGEPKSSGMVLWLVPEVHVFDVQSDFEWEDDRGNATDTIDDTFRINQTAGLGLALTYITSSPFTVTLEGAHHVYLYKAERDLFDGTGLDGDIPRDETELDFRLIDSRVGGLLGVYLLDAPARVYVQAGGAAHFEKFTGFGRDLDAMAFSAAGALGVDYFVSSHFVVGTGLRVDYMLAEEFSGEFTKFSQDHDTTVTLTRIPMNWQMKFGYMF